MNTILIGAALTLVALGGAAVAGTAEPGRQAVTLSLFGLALAVLFFVLQAPDVALSQIAVGTAVVPLMVMLAVRKIDRNPP
ncbi:Na(+)/H(+) antiporter subunit B [Rhizomonospora bruguierae]|uniref:Na(+)/H(+) antiporter subunit B n=1 Tax=Rhizomonospora bruguierae TaxID=1581705 RepID=UPI001BCF2531|nr:DUF4040 domain-containing protein [Micromonospora sp. NBRC 107566]